MADGIFCPNCGRQLHEPYNIAPEDRPPCPHCGSTAREYRVYFGGSVTPTGAVTPVWNEAVRRGQYGRVTAVTGGPSAVQKYIDGHEKRSLTWSKTPGGTHFEEVHDEHGNIVAVAEDVLLVLAEDLLPSGDA